jgi:hypothetical protein
MKKKTEEIGVQSIEDFLKQDGSQAAQPPTVVKSC